MGVSNSRPTLIDHHTHIFSENAHELFEKVAGRSLPPFAASDLHQVLDRDQIYKAAVLSVAYMFASPDLAAPDIEAVRAENDWVGRQVLRHESRLVGFFSVNPLMKESQTEIQRCAKGRFAGLKLHLANSDVDLREPSHVERVAQSFEQANELGFAIVVHLRTRRTDFGREDVEIFSEQVLPMASDVPVQIAHLGGWSGYDDATDTAFETLANLARERTELPLYFDLSAVIKGAGVNPEKGQLLAERLRSAGVHRVLFGSDWPEWNPRDYSNDLLGSLMLTRNECSTILGNRAPWMR